MNTQKRVPTPKCCVLMRNKFTDKQNHWYCYAKDRHGNTCNYKRNGIGNDTYFRWESLNASNGAEVPFRYHYRVFVVDDEDDDPMMIQEDTTNRTQTTPISIPPGHKVRLTLTTIDRTGFQSPTGVFYFTT